MPAYAVIEHLKDCPLIDSSHKILDGLKRKEKS